MYSDRIVAKGKILKEVPKVKEARPGGPPVSIIGRKPAEEARPGRIKFQEARPGGPPVSIIGRKPAEEARPGRPEQEARGQRRQRPETARPETGPEKKSTDSSVNEVAEDYEAGERSLQMSQDTVNKN